MGNYIVSEFKKATNRKLFYAYLIGIVALVLVANIAVVSFRLVYGYNEGTYAYNIIEYATWCFAIPYYSCILIADMAFGMKYPNPHIKDGITGKLNRTQIYLAKLILAVVLSVILMAIAILCLIGVTSLFHLNDGSIRVDSIVSFLSKMCIALPLWFAGIAFGMMFLFLFDNKKKAYIFFFVLTLVLPRLIMLFAAEPFRIAFFRMIRTYTISQHFSLIPYPADPARNVPLCILLGIGYGLIATVIGIIVYNRKEKFPDE